MKNQTNIETRLEQGVDITMTQENTLPEIAERFQIHPGKIYRIICSGENPTDTMTFDGVLTEITAFYDDKGFTPQQIVLEKGFYWADFQQKIPFEKEEWNKGDSRLLKFGQVMDETGFRSIRERLTGTTK